MSAAVLAGRRARLRDSILRLASSLRRQRAALAAKCFFSASPFGDRLSETEFAFCLLLIAAH
jgi:hypothetical protein